MDALLDIFEAMFGLAMFGLAWWVHDKHKSMSRLACIIALVAGLVTYGGPVGTWANNWLGGQAPLILFLLVLFGVIVIVADVKGKKKGADKPALVAFFLVPLFFIGGLASLDEVGGMIGGSIEDIGDKATVQLTTGR